MYNKILVEFEFLIDLDLAIFKLIKDKYNNPEYINQDIIKMNDESKIVDFMINRKNINPLKQIIPNADSLNLYNDIMKNHMDELLKYAKASDIFPLMITDLKEATSVSVTALCNSKLQENFIKSLNTKIQTIIYDDYKKVPVDDYTILYIKYFESAFKYNEIAGKHIYIANARYNMDEETDMPNSELSALFGDVNIIHLIDLYRNIKVERKNNNEQDLF